MIPWIPLSVLSDLAQPRTAPLPDDLQSPRYPLGFTDVRSHALPAVADAPPAQRPHLGFAPAAPTVSDPETLRDPVFRTELSFRRNPRPLPDVRAEATHPGAGQGSSDDVSAADTASELWAGEPYEIASDAGTEAPLPKKERGIFRRRQKQATGDTSEPAEADAEQLHGAEVEVEDELRVELEPVAAEQPVEIEEPEVVIEDEIHDAPQAAADDEVDAGDAPATEAADAEDGDLWGDGGEGFGTDVAADADAEPDAADELFSEPDPEPVVTAVAEPAAKNGRSSRRSGTPKPKKRGSGRSDRGGRKIVGLKIGASQLAAAVVQQVDGRSELLQAARVPLEPGIVVDGDVKDRVALTNALKAFFDDNGLPRKDVRIGLASNRIGVRATDVVGIEDAERFDNAVRFKAHEVLPVAVHESVLDYRVIDERASEEGEPVRRVLLVVAPRDQVEPYLEVCKEAGLRLAGVDLEALGLLRAFVEPRTVRTADDTATVVVSIGHEASTLLVSGSGACEFTRVFDWGGGVLQEAIAQELDVHAAEAATILRHLALSGTPRQLASLDDEARQKAVEAIRSKLTPFARELVSSLQFYQTQPESLGIGEIVITGGTSHLVGLADSLHQMIGVNVRVGDPLQRVVARAALDPALEATIGSLAVPIGLAIEDEAVRSVNLLPSDLRAARAKPDWVKVAVPVAAAASIAALGFLFLDANKTVSNRQSELNAVQAEIAALPQPKRPVIDADVAAGEAARAVALAGVLGGRVSWDGVLRDVSLVLPGNVSLTRLAAQLPPPAPAVAPGTEPAPAPAPVAPALPTGVTVQGYTKDQASVARLLARLRTVPSLTNVQLESSTREVVGKKPIVRFIVLADIKQPGGAQ
jgi:type IV pilus assembly protein PilM